MLSILILLLLFSAGCATATPPPPEVAVTQPAAPEPAAPQPVAKPPVASTPAARPVAARTPPPTVKAPAPQAARKVHAAPTLDLDALKARLRETKAIGVFTKLSLKNKVDDLMKKFTEHYQGRRPPLGELRLSYDLLMMKVLTLLQDGDQPLASDVVASREAIWALLANEKTFSTLQS